MRFIETLLITNTIQNLNYHNQRMNATRAKFFNAKEIDLKNYIKIIPNKRVRIVYDKDIQKVEYFELKKRVFKKFKIVFCDDIDYSFKYEDRNKLNSLKDKNADEVIIVKNGLITDTTISNLAFFNGKEWLTPKKPLLKGTKRQELIDKGFLKEKDIYIDEIKRFKKIALLNAILGFYEVRDLELF